MPQISFTVPAGCLPCCEVCPDTAPPPDTPVYAIKGFVTTGNRYGSVTICDWDCCLFGTGTTGDSVDVAGIGTLNQPTTCPAADCGGCIDDPDGQDCQCAGVDCSGAPPVQDWSGVVDGHAKYACIDSQCAVCVEATGSLTGQIGNVFPIHSLMAARGAIQADNYAYSNITNPACNNADSSNIFYVLGDPSPSNT